MSNAKNLLCVKRRDQDNDQLSYTITKLYKICEAIKIWSTDMSMNLTSTQISVKNYSKKKNKNKK